MSFEKVWKILQETAEIQRKNSKELDKLRESQKETDRQSKESQKETDCRIKELGKQIGGIGNKFGAFTEGLSIPSLEKILREQFGTNEIQHRVKSTLNGGNRELDMVGLQSRGGNRAVIVEIKSKVTPESIAQLKDCLESANEYFPSLEDKIKIGILAGVDFY